LDSEMILKQFDEIEAKVERLVEVIKSLEAANLELKNKNDSLNEGLQNRINTEKSYNEERDLIRSKIDNLLVKLEGIEEA
jgi:FtsZ-binding cell division protein ZapB